MPKRTSIKGKQSRKLVPSGTQKTSSRKSPGRLALGRSAISRFMSEMGRRGGLRGGKARTVSLTKEERSEIARRAAEKRWSKPVRGQTGFEEQKRAFQSIPPQVLAAYTGRFVVSRNGRIVDSDENLSRLTERFFARYGGATVYVTRIGSYVRIATPLIRA